MCFERPLPQLVVQFTRNVKSGRAPFHSSEYSLVLRPVIHLWPKYRYVRFWASVLGRTNERSIVLVPSTMSINLALPCSETALLVLIAGPRLRWCRTSSYRNITLQPFVLHGSSAKSINLRCKWDLSGALRMEHTARRTRIQGTTPSLACGIILLVQNFIRFTKGPNKPVWL